MARPVKVQGVSLPSGITKEQVERVPELPRRFQDEGIVAWYKIWTMPNTKITEEDYGIVAELCQMIGERSTIGRDLELGVIKPFYTLSNRSHVIHPLQKRYDELGIQIRKLYGDLLLTPSARAKLAVESDKNDKMAEFMMRSLTRENERKN